MKNLLSVLLLFCSVVSFSQQNIGSLKNYKRSGNEFLFSGTAGDVRIEFCTPSMFRVQNTWSKTFAPNEPWMVVKYDWSPVTVTVSEQNNFVQLQSTQLSLRLYKPSLKIDVFSRDGRLLSSENIVDGGAFKKKDTVQCTKQMTADEHFFGFGERMDFLGRRGKSLRLNVGRGEGKPYITGAYNILEANYSPVPFFMSTNGYGIFFHTAYPTNWNMGHDRKDAYSFSAEGGELDYYFIYGPKFPNILSQYTALTGRSPLMPLFAYGLHLGTYSGGTWGYEQFTSDQYVIALAKKLRELGIPVDVLWLDSTWRIFGEVGGTGATSFEWRETFKNPKGMFDSLYAMHYKMVGLHLRPRFDNGKTIKLLDTAQQLHYTYPEGSYAGEFVNFFDTASVNFWWNHGVMRVANIGAKFLKTDEGSAFGALANESNKKGPQGKNIAQLHNLFPIAYAKAPYEKFQQYNGIRGMNQTREGYAGIQRYPYIFAGDWPSEWQYFAPVIKAGLNIGLSGVGDWAHCMGGFEHPADPELYIRWVQFGMFSPVAMVFGMDHPGYKEPWNYGAEALHNFRKYDSLRYQLLPYIYSNAFQQYQNGTPLMRALVFDYQDDENVYDIGDEYLFGNDLLVCPVTTKGAQTRTVYLPEGKWYDWWNNKIYDGKKYYTVVTPLDVLPIFVKAGAVIPMQPAMLYTGERKTDTLTLHVFPGSNHFTLYNDDGESLSYQKGVFQITDFSSSLSKGNYELHIRQPKGNYKEQPSFYLLQLHAEKPTSVMVNGKVQTAVQTKDKMNSGNWFYDEGQNSVYLLLPAGKEYRISFKD